MTDFDDGKDGVKWRVAMRAEVEEYLRRHRIDHHPLRLLPEDALAPIMSLWCCEPGLWIVAGDLPTDHLELPCDTHRRVALHAFAERWARTARSLQAAEDANEMGLGEGVEESERAEMGEALQSRADMLRDLASEEKEELMQAREACYEGLFGKLLETVWHSTDEKSPHVDIYQFAPSERRPFWTLVTGGMSDLRQPALLVEPEDLAPRAELVMYVREPKPWMFSVMKGMAEMPFDDDTFLYWGLTVPNGMPMTAEPSELTSYFFDQPSFGDPAVLDVSLEGDRVALLCLRSVTEAERAYAVEHGSAALAELFEARNSGPVVDEQRASIV